MSPPMQVTEEGVFFPLKDAQIHDALEESLEQENAMLKTGLEKALGVATLIQEEFERVKTDIAKEREEWKATAEKAYKDGYRKGYKDASKGIGIILGVNYDGEVVAGIGGYIKLM
jgi:hypothetical protein